LNGARSSPDRGRPVEAGDWHRIRWIGDPDLSEDDRRVAFAVSYLEPAAERRANEVR
jgi:hypothetical protein